MKSICWLDWLHIQRKHFLLLIKRNGLGKKWNANYGGKKCITILYEDTISLLDLVYICRQQYFYKDTKKRFKTFNRLKVCMTLQCHFLIVS